MYLVFLAIVGIMAAGSPIDNKFVTVPGIVIAGQGLASGRTLPPDLSIGTIEAQRPFFTAAGLDIEDYFNGTINLDLSPRSWRPRRALATLRDVKWHSRWPAETFSFFDCELLFEGRSRVALIYHPHPESKPTPFHGRHVFEILTRHIDGIKVGDDVEIRFDPEQIEMEAGVSAEDPPNE